MSGKGIGGHESTAMEKDEWLTPPELIKALGPFDLDPCSPINRPWPTAASHYTVEHNGLALDWFGRVWCNPPYGRQASAWLEKLAQHGNGIALLFARTETAAYVNHIWSKADALLFVEGRITFCHVDGTPADNGGGAPSCFIAYGKNNVDALAQSGIKGSLVFNWLQNGSLK